MEKEKEVIIAKKKDKEERIKDLKMLGIRHTDIDPKDSNAKDEGLTKQPS